MLSEVTEFNLNGRGKDGTLGLDFQPTIQHQMQITKEWWVSLNAKQDPVVSLY